MYNFVVLIIKPLLVKSAVSIYLVLMFFCSTCSNNNEDHNAINQAKSLISINPNSTYLLLNSIVISDKLDNKLFAQWCLLLVTVAHNLHKEMLSISYLLNEIFNTKSKNGKFYKLGVELIP